MLIHDEFRIAEVCISSMKLYSTHTTSIFIKSTQLSNSNSNDAHKGSESSGSYSLQTFATTEKSIKIKKSFNDFLF